MAEAGDNAATPEDDAAGLLSRDARIGGARGTLWKHRFPSRGVRARSAMLSPMFIRACVKVDARVDARACGSTPRLTRAGPHGFRRNRDDTHTHSLSLSLSLSLSFYLAAVFLHASSLRPPVDPRSSYASRRESRSIYSGLVGARISRSYAPLASPRHRKNMSRPSLYPRRARGMMCLLSPWPRCVVPP